MASFKDYLEEMNILKDISKDEAEIRDNLDKQLWTLKENIDLRIEELKCAKDYFKVYDYLYILVSLRSARNKLSEAQDIISGWTSTNEEDIPEDMIFEGEPDDKNRRETKLI